MPELNDNELAVLELIAMQPRAYFPPQVRPFAEMLSRSGLAIQAEGRWYVTAAGLRQTNRTVH